MNVLAWALVTHIIDGECLFADWFIMPLISLLILWKTVFIHIVQTNGFINHVATAPCLFVNC